MGEVDRLPFEALLVSMSKSKDGIKVVLVLHPHDDPEALADLFSHPIGTRYMAVLVPLEDDGTPKPRKPTVTAAAILCRDPAFQQHMGVGSELEAIAALYKHCGVLSRAELEEDQVAKAMFHGLLIEFKEKTK